MKRSARASEIDRPVCRLACSPTPATIGESSNRNRATSWCLDGLMNIARTLDCSSAEALGIQLVAALGAFRGGAEPLDDETIIVMRRTDI